MGVGGGLWRGQGVRVERWIERGVGGCPKLGKSNSKSVWLNRDDPRTIPTQGNYLLSGNTQELCPAARQLAASLFVLGNSGPALQT